MADVVIVIDAMVGAILAALLTSLGGALGFLVVDRIRLGERLAVLETKVEHHEKLYSLTELLRARWLRKDDEDEEKR